MKRGEGRYPSPLACTHSSDGMESRLALQRQGEPDLKGS